MRVGLFAAVSAMAFIQTTAAVGQEATLAAAATVDPLTVIGTRTEKPASAVPASVSVIAAEEIETSIATDIKDLVRYEPGVSVRSSPARFGAALGTTGRDGNAGFNIRGLEGNRVLIQVDGVRTPDAFGFGAQSVGRGDFQDLDLIKQVEILRGPASALYGSDGLAGAVSFTTKDPADILRGDARFGGRVRGAYASADDSYAGSVMAAGRQGDLSALIAYSHRQGHEQETQGTNAAANTDRTTANPQDVRSQSLLGKLVFEPAGGHRLRLTAEHFEREVLADVLSGIAKPPLAATSVVRLMADDDTRRDRVGLDHRWQLSGGPVSQLSWSVYGQWAETQQLTFEDRNTAADRIRRNTFDNRVVGAAAEIQGKVEAAGLTHEWVAGVDASITRQEGVRDGAVPPAGEPFPTRAFPNTDYTLVGVFAQDEIALFDGKLSLFPALRYDWYELEPKTDALLPGFVAVAKSSDGRLSPKLGVLLKPREELGVFVNYGQGFKAPSPSQVNNAFANPIQNYRSIPNPDLEPETSKTIEGGARWTTRTWSAEVAGFAGEYDNFIEQIQVGGTFTPTDPATYQFVNIGRVKIHGVEAKGRFSLDNGFGGFAGAAWSKGDAIAAAKTALPSIDPVKLVAGLTWRSASGAFGGQAVATHVLRKDEDRLGVACTPTCFVPPSFTLVDVTGFWRVADGATLRAGVFNLTDETYWWWSDARGLSATSVSRDAYTQPGRNVSVSLAIDF
ncbi:TonB-dependent hemoglobin/transferrin/lactoferrin family receptor [Phenylobacterium sp.]|jgi:hemoglobin/transferrin/lactoferrin receptor protein|uniref:TonB-dependent hemoglobin/transferrin/lactoferrin family receptor n=1 Tax=Phenylobacterium sp. TaxID=1871053 RepID=UPI003784EEBC